MTSLIRHEIPIDSRFINWIVANEFPCSSMVNQSSPLKEIVSTSDCLFHTGMMESTIDYRNCAVVVTSFLCG
jgi:hypothetical protein